MERTSEPVGVAVPIAELPDHVSLHIAGHGGVLFDSRRQMLFATNPVATLLWCCLAEAMSREESLARLCRATGLCRKDAEAMLETALAHWRADGLLDLPMAADGRPRGPDPLPKAGPGSRDARRPDAPSPATARWRETAGGIPYRLLDTDFLLACHDPAILAMAADPIRHLRRAAAGADAIAIKVATAPDGYVLLRDGKEETRCSQVCELGPLVLALMSWLAVQRSSAVCAIHAGAVVDRGNLVLLPGPAGTGKSTLVAGLTTTGLRAACDDTVLLAGDRLEARPVSVGLCIKEAAWPVLNNVLPALSRRPVHHRPDGLTARYLTDTRGPGAADGAAMPVGRIVFPRYDPDAGAGTIETLDTATALAALSPHIYFLERRLDAALVARLIAWIEAIPCLGLRYATLDDAIRLFAESRS